MLDPPIAHDDDLIKLAYEYLKPISRPVLFDVGASSGGFSLLPTLLPELTVYAFEPNPTVYALLCEHLEMNGMLGNVNPFCEAAWHEVAQLTLSIHLETATGCGTLGKPTVPSIHQWQVPAFPLDVLLHGNGIGHVDLIKIDAEGAEKFVLQGAKRLIERYRPALLVEVAWTTGLLFDYPSDDILRLIESYGYRWEWVKDGNAWCVPR